MSKKGYVYFIRSGDGLLKIGRTSNVEQRFQTIKTSCPTGAELVGYIQTNDQLGLEKKLHDTFADCRKNGEWFDLDTSELLDTYLSFMKEEIVKDHVNQSVYKKELAKLLLELNESRQEIYYDNEPKYIKAIYHNERLYISPKFVRIRLGYEHKHFRNQWVQEGFISRFSTGDKWTDCRIIKHNDKTFRVIQVSPTILTELGLDFSKQGVNQS